jgi:FkbM family methyltransferase
MRGKQFYTKEGKLIDITGWDTSGGAQELGTRYGWEGAMAWGNLIHDELQGLNLTNPFPGIQPGDVFLDLGANIGLSSINAELKGASKIYCLEPDPGVYEALQLNQGENWQLFPIAISNHEGQIEVAKWPNWWVTDLRSCVTLDLFLESNNIDRVDYIKVDIEGFEKIAFNNTKQETWDKIQKLFFEYHDDSKLSEYERDLEHMNFVNFLLNKGFKNFYIEVGFNQSFIYIWK